MLRDIKILRIDRSTILIQFVVFRGFRPSHFQVFLRCTWKELISVSVKRKGWNKNNFYQLSSADVAQIKIEPYSSALSFNSSSTFATTLGEGEMMVLKSEGR